MANDAKSANDGTITSDSYEDKLHRMAFEAALGEERERRRIAVELHDRIGQSLALAESKLTAARDAITGAPRAAVDETLELLREAAGETRTLTFELSPPVLYDLGLKEALAWLAEDIERRYGMNVELTADGASLPLDDTTRTIAFRAVRELLLNVLEHAKTSTAKISLRRTAEGFEIDVEDDGVGFDPREPSDPTDASFGLLRVREQLRRLDGTLEIVSAPAKGTRVSLRLPLGPSPARESAKGVRAGKQLTPRERQVLQLLADGKSSKEIAAALDIALPTVETHRRQLTAKLKLRSIAELTKYAIREGLTSVEP